MRLIDNAIALRILWLLVTPIENTDAYKLGLIDADGTRIKRASTPAENNATSMLHRLVWRIKKFVSLVPGGSTKIGSMVAAYALVRECYENDVEFPTDEYLSESYLNINDVDELNEFVCIFEEGEAPANNTTGIAMKDKPMMRLRRKSAEFNVSDDTFNKFKKGKTKFKRWSKYINLDDDVESQIYHYAKKNPHGILVLKDAKGSTKGIRYSKHGGGNWHKIKRKPKEVLESVLNELEYEMEVFDLD